MSVYLIFSILIINTHLLISYKTIGENSHVEAVRTTTRNAWAAVLRAIDALKQAAADLPNPEIVYEQLRIILRDESTYNQINSKY